MLLNPPPCPNPSKCYDYTIIGIHLRLARERLRFLPQAPRNIGLNGQGFGFNNTGKAGVAADFGKPGGVVVARRHFRSEKSVLVLGGTTCALLEMLVRQMKDVFFASTHVVLCVLEMGGWVTIVLV